MRELLLSLINTLRSSVCYAVDTDLIEMDD